MSTAARLTQRAERLLKRFIEDLDATTLLNRSEVARQLGIDRHRVDTLPMPKVRFGKTGVRWRLQDVREFLDRRAA